MTGITEADEKRKKWAKFYPPNTAGWDLFAVNSFGCLVCRQLIFSRCVLLGNLYKKPRPDRCLNALGQA